MKYVVLVLGLGALIGVSGGLGYTAVRGNPTMPVLDRPLPMSVRNGSAIYRPPGVGGSSSSARGGGVYYGTSRRHYGGGYSYGK